MEATRTTSDETNPPSAVEPSRKGELLEERYELVARLGTGGMSAVYVAEQVRLGRKVAIKLLRPTTDLQARARFAQEAELLAKLQHPGIIQVFDFGWSNRDEPFLVMELVEGWTLRTQLDRGPIPWRNACRLGAQIADALSAAHAEGLVHRDLKPTNLMLDQGGSRVRLLDFGIAQAPREPSEPQLTIEGDVIGTHGYMAPEQALGETIDHRVDIYGLGLLLAEMVRGRKLWEGPRILDQQLRGQRPSLGTQVPEALEKLLDQMLQADAAQRPANAAEVGAQLRAIAQRRRGMRAGLSLVAIATLISIALLWRYGAGEAAPPPQVATAPQGTAPVASTPPPAEESQESQDDDDDVAAVRARFARQIAEARAALEAEAEVAAREAAAAAVADAEVAAREAEAEALERRFRRLVRGSLRQRRSAAHAVLGDRAASDLETTLARLELNRSCGPKRNLVRRLGRIGDRRALPALWRVHALPKTGCGLLNRRDCYSCLREDVLRAIRSVRDSPSGDP